MKYQNMAKLIHKGNWKADDVPIRIEASRRVEKQNDSRKC
jgi:hypothetical protein